MHTISSKVQSWFPVFDWRFEPTFHQHLKWSFPSSLGMWEGPCVFYLKLNWPRETLTQKEAGFPCRGLNSGSYFISQDDGMSESPVETLEKAIVLRLIWIGEYNHFDTSRGTRNSRLQKVMMPDYFWKWIGIPISLFQLESEPWCPASPPEASILSCQAQFRFLMCSS